MKTILMSMRATEASNYIEYRSSIAYEYVSYFENLGYVIILVPNNSNNIEKYFDIGIDLVVLSGGNNVNPKLYNSSDSLNDVYVDRDDIEQKLLNLAIGKKIKILGICRGFHFINVSLGGSLFHGIENHVNKNHKLISKNDILNEQESNSFHNQAIQQENLADKLEVLATSEDNLIEAIVNKEKTILGVQWHPERQDKQFDKDLLNQFLKGQL